MSVDAKLNGYRWACEEVKKAIELGVYGSITFNMKDGVIADSKLESHSKPLLDKHRK